MSGKRALVVAIVVGCGGAGQPAVKPASVANRSPVARTEPQPAGSRATARWVRELDDPRTAERAVSELEILGDPSAIEPLGRLWLAEDRAARPLQVMIALARPLSADEASTQALHAYAKSGRVASWDRVLPYLRKAVTELDEAQPRTVDSAQRAADAIGEAKLVDALPALLLLAKKPTTKTVLTAQIAAIRAVGKLDTARAAAAPALLEILARDPPAHPRTAQTKEQARELETGFGLHLAVAGATINALAALRAEVTTPLLLQVYKTPELFTQLRRAIVASGPGAADEVRKVLRGEHAEVNRLLRDKQLERYCGDKADRPADRCEKLSARDFYAAVILGDLHDRRAELDLLAALARPALPAYYLDDEPGPPQHTAILDALRKLGSASVATPLRTLWMSRKTDLVLRIGAIGVYPFAARDDAGLDAAITELARIAGDNAADDALRQEAATALARLAHEPKHITSLLALAKRYLEASAQKRAAADGQPKRAAELADAELAKAKLALDTAKTQLLAITRDASASADQIRAATAAARKLEADYKIARKVHRDKVTGYKQLDSASKAYLGYARMFQTHVARVAIAIRCKDDVACFAASLTLTGEQAAHDVASYIPDVASWSADEKLGLVEAEVDRAMLELGKRGARAEPTTAVLLDHVASDNRSIRQSILLALPRLAKLPCASCVTKLDAAIKSAEGKPTLGDLVVDTTVLRSYFEWAR